jgi:hypothetical protein
MQQHFNTLKYFKAKFKLNSANQKEQRSGPAEFYTLTQSG